MKRLYDLLDFLPLILIFVVWVAMVMSFFLNFEMPLSGGELS